MVLICGWSVQQVNSLMRARVTEKAGRKPGRGAEGGEGAKTLTRKCVFSLNLKKKEINLGILY